MKLNFKNLALALMFSMGAQAQNSPDQPMKGRGCGTERPPAEWDAWFNQKVEEHKLNMASARTMSTTFVVPIVVHVIYGATNTPVGTYPNISQAQINSQIGVL